MHVLDSKPELNALKQFSDKFDVAPWCCWTAPVQLCCLCVAPPPLSGASTDVTVGSRGPLGVGGPGRPPRLPAPPGRPNPCSLVTRDMYHVWPQMVRCCFPFCRLNNSQVAMLLQESAAITYSRSVLQLYTLLWTAFSLPLAKD